MSKEEMLNELENPAPAEDIPEPKLAHDCAKAESGDTLTEKGEPAICARVEFIKIETE
jgi:hypothetical protein